MQGCLLFRLLHFGLQFAVWANSPFRLGGCVDLPRRVRVQDGDSQPTKRSGHADMV